MFKVANPPAEDQRSNRRSAPHVQRGVTVRAFVILTAAATLGAYVLSRTEGDGELAILVVVLALGAFAKWIRD